MAPERLIHREALAKLTFQDRTLDRWRIRFFDRSCKLQIGARIFSTSHCTGDGSFS